jgi:hypothetical protein
MQALALVWPQIVLSGLFVVPRLVSRARLHGREDAHQPGMLPAFGQDLFYPVFLAHIPLAQELDLDSVFRRQSFGIRTQFIPERLGELRIIEDFDLSLEQV